MNSFSSFCRPIVYKSKEVRFSGFHWNTFFFVFAEAFGMIEMPQNPETIPFLLGN